MSGYILTVDQGTTSTRCMIFDRAGNSLGSGQQEFEQYYPNPGWVEHDPEEIFLSVVSALRKAVDKSGVDPAKIEAIGITNQRETTIVWDKLTGKPIHPAIVWQCRRTAPICEKWKENGSGKDRFGAHRPCDRCILFRNQNKMDSGRYTRRNAGGT